MTKSVNWSKYLMFDQESVHSFRQKFGANKIYVIGLIPVRVPNGFRKLVYEFAEKEIGLENLSFSQF